MTPSRIVTNQGRDEARHYAAPLQHLLRSVNAKLLPAMKQALRAGATRLASHFAEARRKPSNASP